jgi:hypothetical protein
MTTYQLANHSHVIKDGSIRVSLFLPMGMPNPELDLYQTWLSQGNIPIPADISFVIEDRAQIILKIKAERDLRKDGGTFTGGKWFHSDRDSRIQQLGLVMMGAALPAVQWKTMDGSYVTMNQTLAAAIFQATVTLDMALFSTAEVHIGAVSASLLPRDYDFTVGWPAHYVG